MDISIAQPSPSLSPQQSNNLTVPKINWAIPAPLEPYLELTQERYRLLLRHSDVKLTLQCYTHSVSVDRMAAAGNAGSDFQPRRRQKRTESGLKREAIRV